LSKTVDVRSEAKTIRLYTVSIILSVIAILSSFLVGASYTVLTLGSFVAVVSILILAMGIVYARQRKEVTTYYHDRSGSTGRSSTVNARTLGFIAAFWVLFLVIVVAYASLDFLYLVDIVPGSILIISGIVALIGAFTYKIK
jgi:archaellum biogenesis protein FlaJ (TadC family)